MLVILLPDGPFTALILYVYLSQNINKVIVAQIVFRVPSCPLRCIARCAMASNMTRLPVKVLMVAEKPSLAQAIAGILSHGQVSFLSPIAKGILQSCVKHCQSEGVVGQPSIQLGIDIRKHAAQHGITRMLYTPKHVTAFT